VRGLVEQERQRAEVGGGPSHVADACPRPVGGGLGVVAGEAAQQVAGGIAEGVAHELDGGGVDRAEVVKGAAGGPLAVEDRRELGDGGVDRLVSGSLRGHSGLLAAQRAGAGAVV
jgi:hypothetical protein